MSPTNQIIMFIWNTGFGLRFYLDFFMKLPIYNAFRALQLLFWKWNAVHYSLSQTYFTFTFPRSKKMNWFKLGTVIAAPCCICTFIAFSHGLKSVTADTSQPINHGKLRLNLDFRLNVCLRCFPVGFPLKMESCIKLYGLIQDYSYYPGEQDQTEPNVKRCWKKWIHCEKKAAK